MLKVVLVLLYLASGQVVLEQKPTASMDDCLELGEQRAKQLGLDPHVDDLLWGACIPLEVTEVKK